MAEPKPGSTEPPLPTEGGPVPSKQPGATAKDDDGGGDDGDGIEKELLPGDAALLDAGRHCRALADCIDSHSKIVEHEHVLPFLKSTASIVRGVATAISKTRQRFYKDDEGGDDIEKSIASPTLADLRELDDLEKMVETAKEKNNALYPPDAKTGLRPAAWVEAGLPLTRLEGRIWNIRAKHRDRPMWRMHAELEKTKSILDRVEKKLAGVAP